MWGKTPTWCSIHTDTQARNQIQRGNSIRHISSADHSSTSGEDILFLNSLIQQSANSTSLSVKAGKTTTQLRSASPVWESESQDDVQQMIDPVWFPTSAALMLYLYCRSAAITVNMTRQVTRYMTVMSCSWVGRTFFKSQWWALGWGWRSTCLLNGLLVTPFNPLRAPAAQERAAQRRTDTQRQFVALSNNIHIIKQL